MRDCKVCHSPNSVTSTRGPATCPACQREKYRAVKKRYTQSEKGKATRARALRKYRISEHGKMRTAEYDQQTRNLPSRIAVKKRANIRYQQTEKMKAKRRRDYARRKAAIVPDRPFTAEDWIEIVEQHKHRCHYCGKRRVLTIDHVIPLSKGGMHVKENIVPACQSCNSQKKDRLIRLI